MSDIGQVLKEGRTSLGLDLSDVAKRTCISMYYLRAMEEGKFDSIPKVFDRGYLKIYAKLLNMDDAAMLARYDTEKKKMFFKE